MSAVSLCTIFGNTDLVPVTNITSECSLELLSLPALSSAPVPMDTRGGFDTTGLSVLDATESPIKFFTAGVLTSGAIALSANTLGRLPCKFNGTVFELSLSNSDESDDENNFSLLLCATFEDFGVFLDTGSTGLVFSSSSSSLSSLNPSGCLTYVVIFFKYQSKIIMVTLPL